MTMPDFYEKRNAMPATEETATSVTFEPSLFEKARAFMAPDGLYEQVNGAGLYPYFRPIERNEGTRAIINGKEVIMAGSNSHGRSAMSRG